MGIKSLKVLIGGLLITSCLCMVSPTYAFHDNQNRQTDFSAFLLKESQWRVGLFQTEYGIFDWWNIGTYNAFWFLIPVTGQFNGSLYMKAELFNYAGWAASARTTLFYSRIRDTQLGSIQDGDFDATVFPQTLTISHVLDSTWTFSLETSWIQTWINAGATSADDIQALGAAAQSNLQFAFNTEIRLDKVFALNLITRYVPFVTDALISSTAQVDSFTTADIQANAEIDAIQNAWIIQPGFTFSWQRFNLQAGLGYGNFFIPGLRLVAEQKGFTPDFDLYFRF